jgi:mRNA interferase MazF
LEQGFMENVKYSPSKGDVIWLDFKGPTGSSRKAAFVVSEQAFNVATGRILACPVSTKRYGNEFEVPIEVGNDINGCVAADYIRNLDWRSLNAKFAGRSDDQTTNQVLGRIEMVLGVAS